MSSRIGIVASSIRTIPGSSVLDRLAMNDNPYEAPQLTPKQRVPRTGGSADKAWFGVACLIISALGVFGYESSGIGAVMTTAIFLFVGMAYLLSSLFAA
jgi:hypothetical protein